MHLDAKNGNTCWHDAIAVELAQMHEYKTFTENGKDSPTPAGYKKIQTYLVFDTKHVVSVHGFLSELNGLQTWSTNIGNAYLEAKTLELVYIIAGSEFGELEGHTLVIFNTLYGLHNSGLWWYEQFANCLCAMGFWPSKAKPEDLDASEWQCL
jgi:hypothetical protein